MPTMAIHTSQTNKKHPQPAMKRLKAGAKAGRQTCCWGLQRSMEPIGCGKLGQLLFCRVDCGWV